MGRVMFKGNGPPHEDVVVREDVQFCGKTIAIQRVRVQSGGAGLQQAVVSLSDIKKGSGKKPEIASLRNEHCAFRPRINAVRKGDRLEVTNTDPILHNAHGKFGERTVVNVAQVPGGRPVKKIMKYSGQLSVKCDKHDFMQAHVMVFPHPYFAVTDQAGTFLIHSVPAGHHRITVWHETLGQLEQDIRVPPHGTVTVDFEYHE